MFYSEQEIRQRINSEDILIEPFTEECLGPVSYELHLGDEICVVTPQNKESYSGKHPKEKELSMQVIGEDGYTLLPGEFVIAKTREKIKIGNKTMGFFDNKASLAQIGLFTHSGSMLIDPGFDGHITCEIFNANNKPIILFPDQKIGQVIFAEVL